MYQESSSLLRRKRVALTLSRLGAKIAALPQESAFISIKYELRRKVYTRKNEV